MKIRNLLCALGGAVLALAAMKPALATPITYDVNFGASNFIGVFGGTPPANFVLGHFDITLDPHATVTNASTATLDFLTPVPFTGPLAFNYDSTFDVLLIGGASFGAAGIAGGTDDFLLVVQNFLSGSPIFGSFDYNIASNPDNFDTVTGLVFVRQVASAPSVVAATPIPAALPLFISALGGLGFLGWRRGKPAA